jgi:hypothetical protein
MRIETLVDRNVPWRVGLEQLNHVSLQVPDYDFTLEEAGILSCGMPLVG